MADTQAMLEQMGLTRSKTALIGVLSVTLIGVIYWKYVAPSAAATPVPLAARSEAPPIRPQMSSLPPSRSTTVEAESDAESMLVDVDETRWRAPELTEVIAHDPFARPASFPKPLRAIVDGALAAEGTDGAAAAVKAEELAAAVEQIERQLEELKQRGVHVIVNLRDEYVAMIGDRTVRVGDEINGFIVTAIEPDGVRVERKNIE